MSTAPRNNLSNMSILLLVPIIVLLSGCGPQHKRKDLEEIKKSSTIYEETKNNVEVRVKKLNPQEVTQLFDGKGKYLLKGKPPLVILQCGITNFNDQPVWFNPKTISLPTLPDEKVAERLRYSFKSRMAGLFGSLAALPVAVYFGGLFAASFDKSCNCPCKLIPAIIATAATGLLTLGSSPFIGSKYATSIKQANNEINTDVQEKALTKTTEIRAFGKRECLFFVPAQHFKSQFTLSVKNGDYSSEFLVKIS